ncbi:MAG: hypothetical protein COA65_04200 [Rhodospirillaceae bacterium]|nr:MAG: hypothetical protein COA65_04200 [Rhodospirillaceae bacterium]
MLETIRKRTTSWVVKGLLLLLVLSFAVWGIGDVFRGGREATIAKVGDVKITSDQLSREFRREMDRIQHLFENSLTAEQARGLGLLDRALERLISEVIFDLESRDLGIFPSDGLVAARIKETPAFRNRFGEFDKQVFYDLLRSNGYTEEQFASLIRRGIKRNQLMQAITHGTVVPERLGTLLFDFRKEERVVATLSVPAHKMKGVGRPKPETLAAYHSEHAEQYVSPEYRKITAIVVSPDDFRSEVEITETELREEYEARLGEISTPERREIEQILLSDEESATRAETLLEEGKSFEIVAIEVGKVEQGANLSLGSHARKDLIPELSEPAFRLEKGAVSKAIKSPFGWHILRVKTIAPGATPKFEAVRDKIAEDIAHNRAIDSLYAISTQIEDRLASGATFEEAGKVLNLPTLHFENVSAEGKTPDGKAVATLPDIDAFLSTAFNTADGEESTLVETKDGRLFILRVDAITPAALQPLDDIRKQVIADWQAEERNRKAEKMATEIVEKTKTGTSLKKLAGNRRFQIRTSDPLTRDAQDLNSGISHELTRKIFAAKVGEVVQAPSENGYTVALIKEIRKADIDKDIKALESVRANLLQSLANDILDQYIAALEKKHPVETNRSAIEATY